MVRDIPQLVDVPLYFPHPIAGDSTGFIALSSQLTPEAIILAYKCGAFPWYMRFYPVLWYHLYPRAVLFPDQIYRSKSMRKLLRTSRWTVTRNKAFRHVMKQCRDVRRKGQEGSWIHKEMTDAYSALHDMGYAHSYEVWDGDNLIAGLYGMAIGNIFHGESMFTTVSNGSKFALIHACEDLLSRGCKLIDCQQDTDHLRSMGSQTLSLTRWMNALAYNALEEDFVMGLSEEDVVS